jgi:DNA-binding transcriptional MerR regulator
MAKRDRLTVKEFSRLTGIKESTLRYYDKLGIFTPDIRNENTGYRYYSPQQIIAVNSVRLMTELGTPTREISELSKDRTPERMVDVFMKKEDELDTEIRRIQKYHDIVKTFRKMIQLGLIADEKHVSIEYKEETGIVFGPENDFSEGRGFFLPFMKFCEEAERRHIDLRLPIGGYFPDMETALAHPGQPTRFFSIDPNGIEKRPAGGYLTAYSRGYYGEGGDIENRLHNHMEENNMTPLGPIYEVYLFDEISIANTSDYLLQMSVMVK